MRSAEFIKISHVSSSRRWWISERLFRSQSSASWNNEELILEECQSVDAFELFIQWLYTRKYEEENVQVSEFPSLAASDSNLSLNTDTQLSGTLDWSIKAAVLTWTLGRDLGAEKFQDYAMTRLFAAFSRHQVQPITPWLLASVRDEFAKNVGGDPNQLHRFAEDITVRNWGDNQIVNRGNRAGWSDMLKECASFRDKFMEAILQPLEKRRERKMNLGDYLIE
jgi:hypothetical protein